MITFKKPDSKTLSPKSLADILCGDTDSSVNVIENIIQRELVWTIACIETFWHDVVECIKLNIERGSKQGVLSKVFNKAYLVIGNIETSIVDKCSTKYLTDIENGEHKSVVDGSQRNRISLFMVLAFMYEMAKMNQLDRIDMSPFKMDNGEYKLMETGINTLNDFYTVLETKTVKEICKIVEKKSIENLYRKFEEEDKERDYFDVFSLYVKFIERDILSKYDINDSLNIVLRNIYFYEEEIDEENKFERFVDRNKKGTPMSDESMYPKYVINKFDGEDKDRIYHAFKMFKEKAQECEISNKNKDGKFKKTSGGLGAMLYIMIEALKIRLGMEKVFVDDDSDLRHIFASDFKLSDIEYGIEKCFRKGLVFKTADDAVAYFNECYAIASFLVNDSFVRHSSNNIYEDNYYFRGFKKDDILWWYFIKPCYIANKYMRGVNDDRFVFIKKMLFRIYSFYIVYRACNTNSQSLINLIERISMLMVTSTGLSEEEFEKKIRSEVKSFIEKSGGYKGIKDTILSLSYSIRTHYNPIATIFMAMEYDLCEKFLLPTDSFYNLWARKHGKFYNLDHWCPENNFAGEDNELTYQRIGNLVLLEPSLNSSKQDDVKKNSKCYCQSKYIQTLLMEKGNRGVFKNNVLDKINSYDYLKRFSEDEINNPTVELIIDRTKSYADFFVNFVKEFVEE